MKRITPWLIAVAATLCAAPALAVDKSLCVYDPSGANGNIFNMMKDYRAAAAGWGVNFELKPYTDEKTAASDFKAGTCDAVLMTGTRVRAFQKFAGTIEAMGALPKYDQLKQVIRTLSAKGASKLMKSGDYEVAGIFPGGAVYLLVDDKSVDTVEELAGKKLATLEFDDAAKLMVRRVGASMVAADISTFAGMFNNNSVNAAYAPATAYEALELYKGIGDKGGVIKYPLAQMTLQLLIRSEGFPKDFPQKSREYAAKHFSQALKVVEQAEEKVPGKHWITIPPDDRKRYDQMFLDVRVELRDQKKVYNGKMLTLLRRVRCKDDPTRAECAEKRE